MAFVGPSCPGVLLVSLGGEPDFVITMNSNLPKITFGTLNDIASLEAATITVFAIIRNLLSLLGQVRLKVVEVKQYP